MIQNPNFAAVVVVVDKHAQNVSGLERLNLNIYANVTTENLSVRQKARFSRDCMLSLYVPLCFLVVVFFFL